MSKINIEVINHFILLGLDTFKYKMETLTWTEAEASVTGLGQFWFWRPDDIVKKGIAIHVKAS